MTDADFKMLEYFVIHKDVNHNFFYTNYKNEVDIHGQTSNDILKTFTQLLSGKYLDRIIIKKAEHISITEKGEKAYQNEKKKRNEEQSDNTIDRIAKRLFWVPYLISGISVIIAWNALHVSEQTQHNQEQSVTKEGMLKKLKESQESVLHYVDSLYQKGVLKDTLSKK